MAEPEFQVSTDADEAMARVAARQEAANQRNAQDAATSRAEQKFESVDAFGSQAYDAAPARVTAGKVGKKAEEFGFNGDLFKVGYELLANRNGGLDRHDLNQSVKTLGFDDAGKFADEIGLKRTGKTGLLINRNNISAEQETKLMTAAYKAAEYSAKLEKMSPEELMRLAGKSGKTVEAVSAKVGFSADHLQNLREIAQHSGSQADKDAAKEAETKWQGALHDHLDETKKELIGKNNAALQSQYGGESFNNSEMKRTDMFGQKLLGAAGGLGSMAVAGALGGIAHGYSGTWNKYADDDLGSRLLKTAVMGTMNAVVRGVTYSVIGGGIGGALGAVGVHAKGKSENNLHNERADDFAEALEKASKLGADTQKRIQTREAEEARVAQRLEEIRKAPSAPQTTVIPAAAAPAAVAASTLQQPISSSHAATDTVVAAAAGAAVASVTTNNTVTTGTVKGPRPETDEEKARREAQKAVAASQPQTFIVTQASAKPSLMAPTVAAKDVFKVNDTAKLAQFAADLARTQNNNKSLPSANLNTLQSEKGKTAPAPAAASPGYNSAEAARAYAAKQGLVKPAPQQPTVVEKKTGYNVNAVSIKDVSKNDVSELAKTFTKQNPSVATSIKSVVTVMAQDTNAPASPIVPKMPGRDAHMMN